LSEKELDPVEKLLAVTGCSEQHYALQVSVQSTNFSLITHLSYHRTACSNTETGESAKI